MQNPTRTEARPRVLLITPIVPAPTGNGLAMRAGLLVEGLARCSDLTVAVAPVAAADIGEDALEWASGRAERAFLAPLPTASRAVRGWIASDRGRALATCVQPLPARARRAPPELGQEILLRAGGTFDAVYVLRGYLAGLLSPLLDGPSRPRLVLDLDEDDEAALDSIATLHRLRGETQAAEQAESEARAHGRLLESVLPWFDHVLVSSDLERRRLLASRGLDRVSVVPNAVRIARRPPRSETRGRERARLVFIGNLGYAPNRDAAERLMDRVLPAVRRGLPDAELHLVGAGPALPQREAVVVHGAVRDLTEVYRRATMTVVPLRAGGGSRLKILEAFAEGVPVVATRAAIAGLDVRAGEQLLVEDDDEALATAAVRVAQDPALAGALARNGFSFVSRAHDLDGTAESLASLCLGALS